MLNWKILSIFVVVFLVEFSTAQIQVQVEVAQVIEIRKFNATQLSLLATQYNAMRDEVYNVLSKSASSIQAARDTLFSTAQKFPYFLFNNNTELRHNLTIRISENFNFTDMIIDNLYRRSILPIFPFTENNTTPAEIMTKSISDALLPLVQAINNTTQPCLAKIETKNLGKFFTPAINQAVSCIKITNEAYKTQIVEYNRLLAETLPALTKISAALSNCEKANSNRESCIVAVIDSMCSNGTSVCAVANSLNSTNRQAMAMVQESQAIFNVCIQSIPTKIVRDQLQFAIDAITGCTAGTTSPTILNQFISRNAIQEDEILAAIPVEFKKEDRKEKFDSVYEILKNRRKK